MSPELKVGDVLIVDPDQVSKPGGLVVANLQDMNEATVRRYKQLSADGLANEYELIPTNQNWAPIRITQSYKHRIIGSVLVLLRAL